MTTTTLSPADFEKAFTRACVRAMARATRFEPLRGGDQTAVQYGPLIADIADEAELTVPQTRRRLQALQLEGKVLRDDHRGGSTAWWLKGLADTQRLAAPVLTVTHAGVTTQAQAFVQTLHQQVRQGLTVPASLMQRQHWSEVLGVARDCSTSEMREAWSRALAAVDENDLDAAQQRKRINEARSERQKEDGMSEYE